MLKSLYVRWITLGVRSHWLASTPAKLLHMSVAPQMRIITDRANVPRTPSPAAITPNSDQQEAVWSCVQSSGLYPAISMSSSVAAMIHMW
jgi:hypothetical protein